MSERGGDEDLLPGWTCVESKDRPGVVCYQHVSGRRMFRKPQMSDGTYPVSAVKQNLPERPGSEARSTPTTLGADTEARLMEKRATRATDDVTGGKTQGKREQEASGVEVQKNPVAGTGGKNYYVDQSAHQPVTSDQSTLYGSASRLDHLRDSEVRGPAVSRSVHAKTSDGRVAPDFNSSERKNTGNTALKTIPSNARDYGFKADLHKTLGREPFNASFGSARDSKRHQEIDTSRRGGRNSSRPRRSRSPRQDQSRSRSRSPQHHREGKERLYDHHHRENTSNSSQWHRRSRSPSFRSRSPSHFSTAKEKRRYQAVPSEVSRKGLDYQRSTSAWQGDARLDSKAPKSQISSSIPSSDKPELFSTHMSMSSVAKDPQEVARAKLSPANNMASGKTIEMGTATSEPQVQPHIGTNLPVNQSVRIGNDRTDSRSVHDNASAPAEKSVALATRKGGSDLIRTNKIESFVATMANQSVSQGCDASAVVLQSPVPDIDGIKTVKGEIPPNDSTLQVETQLPSTSGPATNKSVVAQASPVTLVMRKRNRATAGSNEATNSLLDDNHSVITSAPGSPRTRPTSLCSTNTNDQPKNDGSVTELVIRRRPSLPTKTTQTAELFNVNVKAAKKKATVASLNSAAGMPETSVSAETSDESKVYPISNIPENETSLLEMRKALDALIMARFPKDHFENIRALILKSLKVSANGFRYGSDQKLLLRWPRDVLVFFGLLNDAEALAEAEKRATGMPRLQFGAAADTVSSGSREYPADFVSLPLRMPLRTDTLTCRVNKTHTNTPFEVHLGGNVIVRKACPREALIAALESETFLVRLRPDAIQLDIEVKKATAHVYVQNGRIRIQGIPASIEGPWPEDEVTGILIKESNGDAYWEFYDDDVMLVAAEKAQRSNQPLEICYRPKDPRMYSPYQNTLKLLRSLANVDYISNPLADDVVHQLFGFSLDIVRHTEASTKRRFIKVKGALQYSFRLVGGDEIARKSIMKVRETLEADEQFIRNALFQNAIEFCIPNLWVNMSHIGPVGGEKITADLDTNVAREAVPSELAPFTDVHLPPSWIETMPQHIRDDQRQLLHHILVGDHTLGNRPSLATLKMFCALQNNQSQPSSFWARVQERTRRTEIVNLSAQCVGCQSVGDIILRVGHAFPNADPVSLLSLIWNYYIALHPLRVMKLGGFTDAREVFNGIYLAPSPGLLDESMPRVEGFVLVKCTSPSASETSRPCVGRVALVHIRGHCWVLQRLDTKEVFAVGNASGADWAVCDDANNFAFAQGIQLERTQWLPEASA